jgi:hypothetical protein
MLRACSSEADFWRIGFAPEQMFPPLLRPSVCEDKRPNESRIAENFFSSGSMVKKKKNRCEVEWSVLGVVECVDTQLRRVCGGGGNFHS